MNSHIEEVIKAKKTSSHNMTSPGAKWDHMVYLRVFEGCNLSCEHCFIPSNPKKMDEESFKNNNITELLLKYAGLKEGQSIYFQWHGGEPTMFGVEYLENAIQNIEKDKRFKYQHGIQTNLINFSDNPEKWADFYFKHFGGNVGISWDYGIRHINRKELTEKTNAEFEEQFWKNLDLAKSFGLNFYMVVTATKMFFERFKNPIEFFEMMVEKGITHLNFERITNNGNARLHWNKLGLNNKEYAEYMSKFFKAYMLYKNNNPEVQLNLSPFDGLLESVVGLLTKEKMSLNQVPGVWDLMSYKNQGYGCWSGQCDTRFHTIDSNGYKHGCTALTSEQDNSNKKLTETIKNKKILWIGSNHQEQKDNILKQRAERQQSCVGCEFLSICSSGCLSVEKFDESGECSGAKTLFSTIRKEVAKKIS